MHKVGIMKVITKWLETENSVFLIDRCVKKHGIEMSGFENQKFNSYAEFFARRKNVMIEKSCTNKLISPCDALLSKYQIENNCSFQVKGSTYRLEDLIPDRDMARQFRGGMCLSFRLEASDYHHFAI